MQQGGVYFLHLTMLPRLFRSILMSALLPIIPIAACSSATDPVQPNGPVVPNEPPQPPQPPNPSGPPTPAVMPAVVFSAQDETGRFRLFRVDSVGDIPIVLTSGPHDDRAPTSSRIHGLVAFIRDGQLHVMERNGANIHPVKHPASMRPTERISWSPDGTRLVFTDTATSGLSMVSMDGSIAVHLTQPNPAPYICEGCPEFRDHTPAWSPDGRKIAFTRVLDMEFSVMWMMNPDGTGGVQVARQRMTGVGWATYSSWSPVWWTSAKIAFSSVDDTMHDVKTYVMNANDTYSAVPIRSNPYGLCAPTDWSDDGVYLLVTCSRTPSEIEVIDVRTGATVFATTGEGASFIR